jgi:hypothetical protein
MMNGMRKGSFHLLAVCICTAHIGACSKPGRNDVSASSAAPGLTGSASSPPRPDRTDFVSRRHRFSVRYPNGAQPKLQELGKVDTAIGVVSDFSYFTGVGDTAYEVMVSVYPSGKLGPDIDGLLKVTRDDALAKPDASLVTERRTSVKTSRGRDVQAHFIEVRMNRGHVYRVTCFFENLGYNIGAGGLLGDPTMQRKTFDEFVESFRLLEEDAL